MTIAGRISRAGVLLVLLWASSCETADEQFPSQGALSVDVTYSQLGTQSAPPPTPQVVLWSIEEASATGILGVDGSYSFLRAPPCFYPLNVLSPLSLNGACRVSGITLSPGVEQTVVLTFRISSMELRQAARPDLRLGADPDGDGVPNGTDNCPIVPNPGQENHNALSELVLVGDACSKLDEDEEPTIPDYDLDGVANAADNCLWYANPLGTEETTQPDADRDGIGDACARVAPVIFAFENSRELALTCPVEFETRASIPSIFRLDFAREGVLTCDTGFTACTIDPTALDVGLVGTTERFPCESVN